MIDPLILTLQLDSSTFEVLNDLRRQHFPRERNHLAAHVTLFHHLPGSEVDAIARTLDAAAAAMETSPITFDTVRHLGRGVAVFASCEPLMALRATLVDAWQLWLTPQDRQPFRPHVTVQNKVDPAVSKALYVRLRESWTPLAATATGLQLWWYRGGPWELAGNYPFRLCMSRGGG